MYVHDIYRVDYVYLLSLRARCSSGSEVRLRATPRESRVRPRQILGLATALGGLLWPAELRAQGASLGLLAGDAMEFIGQLAQLLKRKHYRPGSTGA